MNTRKGLMDAAQGKAPLEELLCRARLLDMATGEIRMADVGLWGGKIAGLYACGERKDARLLKDMDGAYVCPGLMDTHVHLESSHLAPARYAEIVVPQGITTVLWDPHELANVVGLNGVRAAVAASRKLPLSVLIAAPSCVPAAPGLECSGAEVDGAAMEEMLSWPEVAGVAELMNMRGILDDDLLMNGIMEAGLRSGKIMDGHARNLNGLELQAYVAAGIESDHELTDAHDALNKLRAGITLQIRVSHEHLLPEFAQMLCGLPHLSNRVTLCSDDIPPDRLLERGTVIDLVRQFVGMGLPALLALRMATLNSAQFLGLKDRGLIAPGRRADLVIFDDLAKLHVREVYTNGKLAAQGGKLLEKLPEQDFSFLPQGVLPVKEFCAKDFALPVPGMQKGRARIRTIVNPRFTEWGEVEAVVENGRAQLPEGCVLMAVQHRHGRHEKPVQLAFLQNWGEFQGALATTYTHDSHNLVVLGGNGEDMALAANTLRQCGGGMVAVKNGQVLALAPMPLAGMLSAAAPEDLARAFTQVREKSGMVAQWQPPLRVFKALEGISLACNPGPHLTDLGLTDGSTREIVNPVISLYPE